MPPQDLQKINKSRAPMIDSIMNNPKLSRVIHEAASAPLGSTKREKAKAIISILKKSGQNKYQGQGGPGYDGQGGLDFSGMSVAPLDTTGGRSASLFSGSGAASSTNSSSGFNFSFPSIQPSSTTIFPSAPSMKTSGSGSSLAGTLSKYFSGNAPTPSSSSVFKDNSDLGISNSFKIGKTDPKSNISNFFGGLGSSVTAPPISSEKKTGLVQNGQPLTYSAPLGNSSGSSGSWDEPKSYDKTETKKTGADGSTTTTIKHTPVAGETTTGEKGPTTGGTQNPSSDPTDPNAYSSFKFNGGVYKGKGIINTENGDYDISKWATDPNHETAIKNIYGRMADIDVQDAETAQAIITQLSPKSPITGEMVMGAAKKYGGDPKLIIAMMMQDSSLGTAGKAVRTMNPGNVGNDDSENGRAYASWSNGVYAVADLLSKFKATTNGAPDTSTGTSGSSTSGGDTDYLAAYNAAPSYIKENVGPELFAKLMQGASLTDQQAELASTLKTTYDLDNLLAKKNKLEQLNPTIKQDMTDYIKSRDNYVSSIDGMLDNVNQTMATTDISNPGTNKMYQDYKNYLLTLKGRQNQRYAQYLNTSIDQYNNELTGIQNQYTNAVSAYDTALKSGGDRIKDHYDETHKILTDMYKTLEDAPGKSLDLLKKQKDLNEALLDNANSIAGYKKDWLPQVSSYSDRIVDKTSGALIPDVNLPGLVQQLSIEQNYNPIGVLDTFTNGALTKLKGMAASKDPSVFKSAQEYMKQLDSAIDPATSNLSAEARQQIAPRLADMKQSLINTIAGDVKTGTDGVRTSSGLMGYLASNYGTINKLAKELSGEKVHWYSSAKPIPTRDQLISEYNNLDPEVVGAIYDSDQLVKNQLGNDYTIINGLQKVTIPNNTSGGASLVGLPPEEQMARYLTARITEPFKYSSVLNQ